MKVIIAGSDGYLGWPLTLRLLSRGHQVIGADDFSRRRRVRSVKGSSATKIADPFERVYMVRSLYPDFALRAMDFLDSTEVDYLFKKWKPDACVHLAEIPSAPYSMMDAEHCNETFMNNIQGTINILYAIKKHVPNCHLIKLGTMGEYGTPNIDIPEGTIEIEFRGRKDVLPFPKQPGSFYHATKVADTINIQFAQRIWNLRCTDIHQGVVHGIETPEMLLHPSFITRFDFDQIFGTVLNRFVAQAIIGHKLTPYGEGGQTRGFIALRDAMQCITLILENPPEEAEYRTFHQFDECYTVMDLAKRVVNVAQKFDLDPEIWNIPNPRVEAETHYYNPDCNNLRNLGFKPTFTLEEELNVTFKRLLPLKEYMSRKRDTVMPTVNWRE